MADTDTSFGAWFTSPPTRQEIAVVRQLLECTPLQAVQIVLGVEILQALEMGLFEDDADPTDEDEEEPWKRRR